MSQSVTRTMMKLSKVKVIKNHCPFCGEVSDSKQYMNEHIKDHLQKHLKLQQSTQSKNEVEREKQNETLDEKQIEREKIIDETLSEISAAFHKNITKVLEMTPEENKIDQVNNVRDKNEDLTDEINKNNEHNLDFSRKPVVKNVLKEEEHIPEKNMIDKMNIVSGKIETNVSLEVTHSEVSSSLVDPNIPDEIASQKKTDKFSKNVERNKPGRVDIGRDDIEEIKIVSERDCDTKNAHNPKEEHNNEKRIDEVKIVNQNCGLKSDVLKDTKNKDDTVNFVIKNNNDFIGKAPEIKSEKNNTDIVNKLVEQNDDLTEEIITLSEEDELVQISSDKENDMRKRDTKVEILEVDDDFNSVKEDSILQKNIEGQIKITFYEGNRYDCPFCQNSYEDFGAHLCFSHGVMKCGQVDHGNLYFKNIDALKKHVHSFHKEKSYKCLQCRKTFSNIYHLIEHRKLAHSLNYCILCNYHPVNDKDFFNHMKPHNITHMNILRSDMSKPLLLDYSLATLIKEGKIIKCNLCADGIGKGQNMFNIVNGGTLLWNHFQSIHKIGKPHLKLLPLFDGKYFNFKFLGVTTALLKFNNMIKMEKVEPIKVDKQRTRNVTTSDKSETRGVNNKVKLEDVAKCNEEKINNGQTKNVNKLDTHDVNYIKVVSSKNVSPMRANYKVKIEKVEASTDVKIIKLETNNMIKVEKPQAKKVNIKSELFSKSTAKIKSEENNSINKVNTLEPQSMHEVETSNNSPRRLRQRRSVGTMKLEEKSVDLKHLNEKMRRVLSLLQEKDVYGLFAEPVDTEEVPDYLHIIKNPMDFSTMRKKIDNLKYRTLEDLEKDFVQIIDNCLSYNEKQSDVYMAGIDMRDNGNKIFIKEKLNTNTPDYATYKKLSMEVVVELSKIKVNKSHQIHSSEERKIEQDNSEAVEQENKKVKYDLDFLRGCNICLQIFDKSPGIFKRHLLSDHKNAKFYDCSQCDFISFKSSATETHFEKVHKGVETPCPKCGLVFSGKFLKIHVRKCMERSLKVEEIVNCDDFIKMENKCFICLHCDLAFEMYADIYNHIQESSQTTPIVVKKETNHVVIKQEKYKEKPITMAKANPGIIKQEMRKRHQSNPDTEYKCSKCHKRFTNRVTLVKHEIKRHTLTRRERGCSFCDIQFESLYLKREHQQRHKNGELAEKVDAVDNNINKTNITVTNNDDNVINIKNEVAIIDNNGTSDKNNISGINKKFTNTDNNISNFKIERKRKVLDTTNVPVPSNLKIAKIDNPVTSIKHEVVVIDNNVDSVNKNITNNIGNFKRGGKNLVSYETNVTIPRNLNISKVENQLSAQNSISDVEKNILNMDKNSENFKIDGKRKNLEETNVVMPRNLKKKMDKLWSLCVTEVRHHFFVY